MKRFKDYLKEEGWFTRNTKWLTNPTAPKEADPNNAKGLPSYIDPKTPAGGQAVTPSNPDKFKVVKQEPVSSESGVKGIGKLAPGVGSSTPGMQHPVMRPEQYPRDIGEKPEKLNPHGQNAPEPDSVNPPSMYPFNRPGSSSNQTESGK